MNVSGKILVVDDEELIRINLQALLEDLGYQVVTAADGQEGLAVFHKELPDLVLADLRMPVMDGRTMIARLHDETPDIPLVIVSGTGTVRDAMELLHLGAWDYVVKPVEDVESFDILIRRALEKALLIRENRRYRDHLEELVREQTEELRRSEARYRRLLESVTSYLYTVVVRENLSETTVHGPGCEAVTGFTSDEFAADLQLWYRMVHQADRSMVLAMANRIFSEIDPVTFEHRIHHKDGTLRWIRNTLVPHRTATGELVSYDGIVVDITEAKEAQEEIERIGNRNQLILESVGDGIFGLDLDGKVLFINRAAADFLGYEKDELIGKDLHMLIHMRKENGAPYDKGECPVCKTFEDGTPRSITDEVFWRKNGTSFPVEYSSTPIMENGSSIGAVVTFKNVADRQKVERQLQQAEKMEAIGTLAGGIAHDFNNILSSIFGFTEIAKSKFGTGEDLRKDLDEVLQAGLRARDLVKHILLFSRQVDIKRAPVMITPLVKECLKFLRASVPSTIEILRDIAASKAAVVADPTEIHQILMNLCTNAAHAMAEKGGTLSVRLREVAITSKKILPDQKLKPGCYFQLTVADTGHGISPELVDRIFEPFFTTKMRGEGTGLGLSIVHGIVKKLNGAVSVESDIGKGTTFHVWLPLHEEAAAKVRSTDMPSGGGKGKILFVDDENNIVITAKKLLENLGYTVIATLSPFHALEMVKSREQRFDLVITDLTMPKMTGIELSKQLLAIEPDLPVILCTGFSATISQEILEKVGIREVIMKPMITSELAKKIGDVLKSEERKVKRD